MGVIQCGSFSGNTTVTLGWEPQWMMIKRTDSTGDWITIDNMRGCSVGGIDAVLFPNLPNTESVANDYIDFTATGFISKNLTGTYIYMVIRRPMKVPKSSSEVFAIDTRNNYAAGYAYFSGFPVDLAINHGILGTTWHSAYTRMTSSVLDLNLTNSEGTQTSEHFAFNNGFFMYPSYDASQITHMFKRAKGFFDVVCYTGTGVARTVNHNLGVVPEMIWEKPRNLANNWVVYHKDFPSALNFMTLNSTAILNSYLGIWNNTRPTDMVVTLGDEVNINGVSSTNILYLFATLAGISKVGSYTGNGTSQTIPCGFSTGARFILIKRTNAIGDWYIWDTTRGIVAANDPHLSLNTTAAQVTTDDSVDPAVEGFIVNQNTATNINVNGGSYIFLAIA